MTDSITDPVDDHSFVLKFYSQLRGPKTKNKHYVLNQCLLWFSTNYKKIGYDHVDLLNLPFTEECAEAVYESTTTQTCLKEIFVDFREHGILYGHWVDFRGEGGYANFFTKLWAATVVFRPTFGRLSHSSTFDDNAEQKIRKYENYKPFENFEDLMDLLVHGTLK